MPGTELAQSRRMAGIFWVSLALCLLSSSHSASLPPAVRVAGDSDLIEKAVADYNKASDSEFIFTLLEDGGGTESGGANQMRFTIKETVCEKSEYKTTDRCDYKVGGVEKSCRASLEDNHFTVICTSAPDRTSKDGGHGKSSDGDPGVPHGRTIIIKESRVIPDADEEVVVTPEDEDDDYNLHDTVIEFHDDPQDEEPGPRPQSDKRMVFPRDDLGRILCLQCIIDIFPRK